MANGADPLCRKRDESAGNILSAVSCALYYDGAFRTEDVFAAVFRTTLKIATAMRIHLD